MAVCQDIFWRTQSTSQPTYLHQPIPRQFTSSSMSLRSCCCCDSPAALLLSSVVQVEEVCNRSRVVPQRPLLQLPRTRTAYDSRTFSVAVPNIWNKLPGDVLTVNSLPVFRRRSPEMVAEKRNKTNILLLLIC